MKILHIISSTNPQGGGPIESITQLSAPLQEIGVTTEIACCDTPDAPWITTTDLMKIHALGPAKGKYGYASQLVPWLRKNAHNFDAVIVNGIWQYHSFATWQALAGTNVPYFVYTHGMLDPWFKHAYPLKHLKKWLYWPWTDYKVLRDARAVLFTCEEERRLASQSFWLYKANEAVVKFGTATPPRDSKHLRETFLSAFPDLHAKRLLLFLSRIHEKKGCDLLIEAFSRVADLDASLELVMAGPDQTGWAIELQKLAERLGVADRITWTGMVRDDLKWGAFYASELFLLPSHQENFGIAVAESLGCGVPVLISNKVNIWREIETDGAGLVGDDNLEDTESNLRHWLSLNALQRAEMGRMARRSFMERFTVEQMANSLVETIKRGSQ